MGVFQPRFVFESELSKFGLPYNASGDNTAILNLVDTASVMIDEFCGRTDGDGNGSLVYTTYQERILAQSPGRNYYVIPHRPIVAVTADQISAIVALDSAASGNYFTGVLPSVNTLADGRLSGIISASGRYIPARRDGYGFADEPNSWVNPLNTITLFGGPPPWNIIDMIQLDYDSQTGELWLSSGLYLARYSEVVVVYNSGYDPANMPVQIKRACAAVVKNLMAKGTGTTGMTSFSSSKIGMSAEFTEDVLDQNVQRMLAAFVTVRAT